MLSCEFGHRRVVRIATWLVAICFCSAPYSVTAQQALVQFVETPSTNSAFQPSDVAAGNTSASLKTTSRRTAVVVSSVESVDFEDGGTSRPAAKRVNVEKNSLKPLFQGLTAKAIDPQDTQPIHDSFPAKLSSSEDASRFNAGDLIGRLVIGVTLATLLFVGIVLFAPKFLRVRSGKQRHQREMELVDTIYVAPRCCLHLVSVQDQLILVGRDATGMKEIVPIRSAFDARLDEATEVGMSLDQFSEEHLSNGATTWP